MEKVCCRCKTLKNIECFTINRARKDGRNSACKECHRPYTKKHYQNNVNYYVDKAAIRARATKDWLDEYKESKGCADCKQFFPSYVLDFDHLSEKEFNIAGSYKKVGQATLLAEISKCEVVCANCHRERTHKRLHAHEV